MDMASVFIAFVPIGKRKPMCHLFKSEEEELVVDRVIFRGKFCELMILARRSC